MSKTIRCPVHGCIELNDIEWRIVCTPFFRRLDHVRQLSTASVIYPGATHTRFSHSLGAMHLAGKYATQLIEKSCNVPFPSNFVQLTRICALLHDIGHGPFSHSFDRSIYSQIYNVEDGGHDFHRYKIVEHSSIATILADTGILPRQIQDVWSAKREGLWFNKIIRLITQGPLGADRLDFTLRDSYYTGVHHFGSVPIDRIINKSRVMRHADDYYLCYNSRSLDDIIRVLEGRKSMYINVYLHPKVIAAGILIEKLLEKSARHLDLVERTQNLDKFVHVNDHILGECMGCPETHSSAQDVLDANLPKLISESISTQVPDQPKLKDGETLVVTREIGGFNLKELANIRLYCRSSDKIDVKTVEECLRPDQTPTVPVYISRVYRDT